MGGPSRTVKQTKANPGTSAGEFQKSTRSPRVARASRPWESPQSAGNTRAGRPCHILPPSVSISAKTSSALPFGDFVTLLVTWGRFLKLWKGYERRLCAATRPYSKMARSCSPWRDLASLTPSCCHCFASLAMTAKGWLAPGTTLMETFAPIQEMLSQHHEKRPEVQSMLSLEGGFSAPSVRLDPSSFCRPKPTSAPARLEVVSQASDGSRPLSTTSARFPERHKSPTFCIDFARGILYLVPRWLGRAFSPVSHKWYT
jgi:hypothetical protein